MKQNDSTPKMKAKALNATEDPSKKNPRSLFTAYLGKKREKSIKKQIAKRAQRSPTPKENRQMKKISTQKIHMFETLKTEPAEGPRAPISHRSLRTSEDQKKEEVFEISHDQKDQEPSFITNSLKQWVAPP